MKKDEFLNELRTVLTGELPDIEVENNIKFYYDYINTISSDKTEEEVMKQLGEPRLIAKTIIETYQISHTPLYNAARHKNAYQDINTEKEHEYEDLRNRGANEKNRRMHTFQFGAPLTIYQKLLLSLVIIVFISLVLVIGGILLRLFFTFGLPILLILMIYKIIKNSIRK